MQPEMTCTRIEVSGSRSETIEAYVARPHPSSPGPAVVLVHHGPGLDEHTREAARSFADRGYLCVVPNLYSRLETSMSTSDAFRASLAAGGLADDQVVGDVAGSVAAARAAVECDGRVCLIGYCAGGRQAFLAACRIEVDGVIDCYGGGHFASWPSTRPLGSANPDYSPGGDAWRGTSSPAALASSLSAPLLGLFGTADPFIHPGEVAALRRELESLGKPHQIELYEGATHAFFNVGRWDHIAYTAADVLASQQGRERIWSWLSATLPA